MILTTPTTKLAATSAPVCPIVTADHLDFVNNSDGCIVAKFSGQDHNGRTRIKIIYYEVIFCIHDCLTAFVDKLYSEGGGCVVPNTSLNELKENDAPYIFCGRLIDDKSKEKEVALTAMPVESNKRLYEAIYAKYGNIPCHISCPVIAFQASAILNVPLQMLKAEQCAAITALTTIDHFPR